MLKQKSAVVYFNNLDSFRAIAALLVIFYHIPLHLNIPQNTISYHLLSLMSFNSQGGPVGVTFFFTLSGFLITYLMFTELEKTGDFSILSFYMRRVLRIWPLYYLTLLIGFIVFPVITNLSGLTYPQNPNSLLYILFLTNFEHIINTKHVPGPLGVQWSVAIEEQFYLLWPIIFSISNKKYFPIVLLAIMLGSEIYFSLPNTWQIKYYHTFCNIRFLSAGALLAAIAYQHPIIIKKTLGLISKTTTVLIYISGILLIFFSKAIATAFPIYGYVNHLFGLAFFLYVIAEQTFSPNRLFNLGSSRIFTSLGKISYGLYLLHMIVIIAVSTIFHKSDQWIELQIVMVLFFTILLSYISYHYYESTFLKLKTRFSFIKTGSL